METLKTFISRNQNYVKHQDANADTINKYADVLPPEIIYIWRTFGFGTFENGFIRFVDPDDHNWALKYCSVYLEPTIVIAITALGDLIVWEGNTNWTVSPEEGNRYSLYIFRKQRKVILGTDDFVVNVIIGNREDIQYKKSFDSAIFFEAKEKLGMLEFDESYGFVPLPAFGGKEKLKDLRKVKTSEYLDIIGQTVGMID